MSFFTSLSGLRGAQTDLNTVSNNVANVGTHGFKRSRAEFGDLMPPSRTTPGMGTKLKGLQQVFSQGGFEATTRNLDMAISGPGFFLTRDSLTGGQSQFTRAGSFAINADRYLVDSNNAYVQVLPVDASGNLVSRTLAAARNLQLPLTSGIPRATSLIDLAVSLPSSADKPSARSIYGPSNPYAFDRADPNSFNFQQQTTVYDASGQAFPATLYFTRSASTAAGDADNRWQVNAFIGDASATSTPIELVFDSTGALTSPTGPQALDSITPPTASAPLSISLDFGTATLQSTGT
nr:flagellar hook-basal body complex protein [Sphingopyxis sp.]